VEQKDNTAADRLRRHIDLGWRRLRLHGPGQVQFWLIALLIGILAGLAALLFRAGIDALQAALYGADDRAILDVAGDLPWYLLVAIPAAGGLVVGLILHRFTPDGRVRAVADVIEGAALNRGRVETREGLASAAASLITLGTGGSSGREGPVVHLAGVISTAIARRIDASGITGRDLLGCAVAAAVSASFNAPIAGAIFAMEVVLRHHALHAFAPIAIASVAGTVINRLHYGNVAEFTLPESQGVAFYWEIPAFLILGIVAGAVAVVMIRAIFWTEDQASRLQAATGLPRWLRPGHRRRARRRDGDTVPRGDRHRLPGHLAGADRPDAPARGHRHRRAQGRRGRDHAGRADGRRHLLAGAGGGALTGLAFGLIATGVLPQVSGAATVYALAGMGAVAAAVLGAPVSTTLIVFEMTGDWQTAIAVLAAVSTATAVASRFIHRSFFLTQLARRGACASRRGRRNTCSRSPPSAARCASPAAAARADTEALEALLRAGPCARRRCLAEDRAAAFRPDRRDASRRHPARPRRRDPDGGAMTALFRPPHPHIWARAAYETEADI
jgi:chloride channel protein, CIC family